jgi:hypothetical protein
LSKQSDPLLLATVVVLCSVWVCPGKLPFCAKIDQKKQQEVCLGSAKSVCFDNHFRDAVRAKGGISRIVATGMWGRDEAETLRKLHEWNQPIHRMRGRIEKIFGTWKRCYGLRRMRWRGLAKAAVRVTLPSPPITLSAQ